MDEGQQPLVSVVIATYNYSSVLKYAIQSVLWQTFQNFEIWVIGDACTDDSEDVVRSFADPRVHWVNLPQNSGSQSIPNNEGIARARGKYVAYLGHDDLWYPTHLEVLVNALETSGADAAHTLLLSKQPQDPQYALYGLSGSAEHDPFLIVPPSSLIHLRSLGEAVGGWKDYRTLRIPPDIEFVGRIAQMSKAFVSLKEVTVFKFPSAKRKNVYVEKPSHEQAAYAERIQHEPDFRYRELMNVLEASPAAQQALEIKFAPPTMKPGELVESWRAYRGLAPQAPLEAASLEASLLQDTVVLAYYNLPDDITPEAARQYLHTRHQLPKNGVLLGLGWYACERDSAGKPFRWVNTDAEIVLTELDARGWRLTLKARLGYANYRMPVTVALVNSEGVTLGRAVVWGERQVSFPIASKGGTAVYRLRVSGSLNKPTKHDPRILNIGVSDIRLETEDA